MIEHKGFGVPIGPDILALGPMPTIMGILNLTPDSFSDGGEHNSLAGALSQTRLMLNEGADIIDIGGQSTRPGANEVSTQQELERVVPTIEYLISEGIKAPLSIDSFKAVIADQAIQAGAKIINDVHGLQREPEIADVAALYGAPLIIMHWDKKRDQDLDIIDEMLRFFEISLNIAHKAGLAREKIIIDPGFGFAKSLAENYEILRRLGELHTLGVPVLAGTSRKSMLGKLLDDVPPAKRVVASAAASTIAYHRGVHIFRCHDVRANHEALMVAHATQYGPPAQE
ncbi:Dihydropteroate synthase [hydrothermal vent metagenome]|uniref:dihydropteroate synthase n=1 Tax=hydrothermal vent metagenome TaxID=652676 RepID=A0A3B0T560_9ZZZZ